MLLNVLGLKRYAIFLMPYLKTCTVRATVNLSLMMVILSVERDPKGFHQDLHHSNQAFRIWFVLEVRNYATVFVDIVCSGKKIKPPTTHQAKMILSERVNSFRKLYPPPVGLRQYP
jgi:hypothetical protein